MTTTNVYQGLDGQKSSSRVLAPPGGGGSNIFGHYQEEENQATAQRRQAETQRVIESNTASEQRQSDRNFFQDKADFSANKARNQGTEAPFATGNSMIQAEPRSHARQTSGEPAPAYQAAEEYISPKEKQANNPNLNKNTFSNIFGEEPSGPAKNNRGAAKASKYNPITWSAQQRMMSEANQIIPPSWKFVESPPAGTITVPEDNQPLKKPLAPVKEDPIAGRLPGQPTPTTSEIQLTLPLRPPYLPKSPHDVLTPRKSLITYHESPYTTPSPSEVELGVARTRQSRLKSALDCLAIRMSPITHQIPGIFENTESDCSCCLDWDDTESLDETSEISLRRIVSDPTDFTLSQKYTQRRQRRCFLERNPVNGHGISPKTKPQLRQFSSDSVASRNPLTGNGLKSIDEFRDNTRKYSYAPEPHIKYYTSTIDDKVSRKASCIEESVKQASTHNPVTWEAYSNYDANADRPAHRSRFETHKDMRQGNPNPITGQEPGDKPSTRVKAPPGGISNITF